MHPASSHLQDALTIRAAELGIGTEALECALYILSSNRELINALDNKAEMDEYIYRTIIKTAIDRRQRQAEKNLDGEDASLQLAAERDLSLLSREELMSDPYYRAILPIISKIVVQGPILRLHADEASEIILNLADFKRRHRVTTLTEVIVTRCRAELDAWQPDATTTLPASLR
ncbi:MAG TPA: hypothetical protein VHK69_03885 [Chitinophagaceae bacterium]|nr:hypothetical protein [Chitinophagaceae bacterium]